MGISDLYSKRNKDFEPSGLVYDHISFKLKNQIFHIWNDFFNQRGFETEAKKMAWEKVHDDICKEHGFGRTIYENYDAPRTNRDQVEAYYRSLKSDDVVYTLDIIEAVFVVLKISEKIFRNRHVAFRISYAKCVEYLNTRLAENHMGYRFQQDQIIRITNDLLYKEAG